ncbi:cyclic beta 1-2 glucan synthetase [Undibacterium sp. Jales W-56]|uniref:glycoside hydrolase family 94 protein n=1 Tax=Undibacterium sp. Jales W-56 TaxID=2897325 RepID=UPI0021D2417F|nr:glycoside hydrolase family 94 protein [Undibacterium sp. Jales W-56]MCU6433999.1 cyclic beta 1-2 glucan synthetase [Undibacterium sp. Jales W-56]
MIKISSASRSYSDDEQQLPPLKSELFSVAQMEMHGRVLAGRHKIGIDKSADQLLPRLAANEVALIDACAALTAALRENRQITPAAEWLLDNFYLIEEQIRIAKQHLPKGYSKELPRLTNGPSTGKPRVYDIALETISHGDGRVDPEGLSRFVTAYQQITVLRLGELWAIPIMLRLALIENLRRVATRIATGRIHRNLANAWADELIDAADKEPGNLILLVADMARAEPLLDSSFVAEVARRLQGQSPALTLPLTWVAQRLSETGVTIEQLVQLETQQQAADQVSISNSIGSLRFLGAMDWRDFVETMSYVEQVLRRDHTAIYSNMDFATRDRYRHVIENLAKHAALTEVEVAEQALLLSTPHRETIEADRQTDAAGGLFTGPPSADAAAPVQPRTAHIGYFLIGQGLPALEQAIDVRYGFFKKIIKKNKHALPDFYLSAIFALTALFTLVVLKKSYDDGLRDLLLAVSGILAFFAGSQLALALVNWFATLMATPNPLPRMDFSSGIPATARSIVVVPTMLLHEQTIDSLIEALEVRFLANRDPNLFFCLLTDFADAATETTPADRALIDLAAAAITQLNRTYGNDAHSPFFLMHRPRRWNPQEKSWMGYERKRGKLSDLNAFLRGSTQPLFSHIVGNIALLSDIKYVITLDSDTQLPRDSARLFIATIAHPLNQAVYDENRQRVIEGYGILQPRVVSSLPTANASWYEKLCGGEAGIDPYTRSVSDVYQDLFQEGSFIGKGIYDIDAFELALNAQLPENRILSHDLLEGCYARSGLISDIQLHEEYPSRYSADVSRRHRWIRGDWQILSWLLPKIPAVEKSAAGSMPVSGSSPSTRTRPRKRINPLSMLSRWKILDNLRRSLISPVLILLLLFAWFCLPSAWVGSAAVLIILFLPSLAASLWGLANKSREVLVSQHLLVALRSTERHLMQVVLNLAFLPYEAWYSLDAIVRTLWRMTISHQRMLEWKPSSEANQQMDSGLMQSVRSMWRAPFFALGLLAALFFIRPSALPVAFPFLLLWLVSPVIAWWVSRPVDKKTSELRPEHLVFLHRLARKTWAFFDTYVGPQDHWLPPDNMQEHPVAVVAHRTSPTNIGLALLANLSAYDFAYIPMSQLLYRTDKTLASMALLERYQGHFYNWYDTTTLQPLHPMYVSTVDSGNLAGHLMTLKVGLLQLADQPIVSPAVFQGLAHTFQVLLDAADVHPSKEMQAFHQYLDDACTGSPNSLYAAIANLDLLERKALDLLDQIERQSGLAADSAIAPEKKQQQVRWAHALVRQCADTRDDLLFLAPWLTEPQLMPVCSDIAALTRIPTLSELARFDVEIPPVIARMTGYGTTQAGDPAVWARLAEVVAKASLRATERIAQIQQLALRSVEFARMEYGFLYEPTTHLLAIGYNVTDRRLDTGCYDLLASEARLCSFVAIAQGQLPQETWFALGRQLTLAGGEPILLSWSGSMFEYLMPLLVMPNYDDTLLDQTYKSVVQRQIEYGAQRAVPWGISESGYHAFDASLNYQYRAFGVPGLGLKRGLGDDLVVAPYASMLALMVAPEQACENLQRLANEGVEGDFGMYEAIDYTPSRLPRGQTQALIRSYMAHHQGMSLLSLAYVLSDRPMQRRFESDPLFQATLLLLKERIPKPSAFYSNTTELADIRSAAGEQEMPMRIITKTDLRIPEVQLLSNGRYHMMVTNNGGSYSRWRDLAITRWREDSTCDNWGSFCYVRDLLDGSFWSAAHQPTLKPSKAYEVIFSEGRAEFRRRDNGLDTYTTIVVSPEDDIELRRTRITNRSRIAKTIDVTSYAEVVLAPAAADTMHPAFSNLFVQTEILPQESAILCSRRPRSENDFTPSMFHLMVVHGAQSQASSYETDRMAFIGRGNTARAPLAMTDKTLSGNQGSVLDPIVAIRHQITLAPEQTVIIDMVTGVAETRAQVLGLIDKYQDMHLADRVFELAWTHSHVVLRQLNASEADAQLYGRLANSVIYSNALLRAEASILVKNRRGQSGLWSYAISGDLPIVLLQISAAENIELVRQMVQAHAYWRMKGLAVDLVIWNEDRAGYRQILQEQIMGLVASGIEAHAMERPGGIFVRLADQIPNEDRILLQSVARAILSDARGTLAEQINRRGQVEVRMPLLTLSKQPAALFAPFASSIARNDLLLFNGIGGFSPDGREYVINTSAEKTTPAPWVNVLANAHFGTVISESGQSYTWGENAHEFRLTPWSNDPVSDAGGEVFYLRDEESGHFWSPTPLPSCGQGAYVTRHGFGYSVFEHIEDGIKSELTVYVALDDAIKFSVLKVRNDSGATRLLSATGYVEWVLGDVRQKSVMHIVTEADPATGAIFARNSYNAEFCDRTAFFYSDGMALSMSGDRTEFIGRNGSLQHPAAMSRTRLSGKLGAGLDPCAAIQIPFDLADGEQREMIFMLGTAGQRSADVSNLIRRYRGTMAAGEALAAVKQYWNTALGAVQVETPDISLNILSNGWLMYQTLACRLWGRSGFYQSGGAFGFRDQLQDVMALIHTQPQLAREHLVLCAAHQFVEGDVQHWWHPPTNRGVRTHCSDDYLWLPLATCRYVTSTHDYQILDEKITFLEGRQVNFDEDSYYDLPGQSNETATLYQHCARAIAHGLRYGVHGLPLIGSCDWNDGMDKVGSEGKGESVWLAFFLYQVLMRFSELAAQRDDPVFSERCRLEATTLQRNIEQHAWDGGWYRRAYFDDGTPLGSASNEECQIDSISQSWAVLSGAGDAVRARTAMLAVDQRLVRRKDALVQLLDPPFDHSDQNPGYIRGYVPGVRENGGQYTHAAIWTAMAFAKLGDSQRAWELFDMINPLNHARTPVEVARYKVEPYVVAADVYGVSPHIGRGGWTWYTGSSGWMYRFILESLLGLTLEGDQLRIQPCLSADWNQFTLHYRYRDTTYHIHVTQTYGERKAVAISIDGVIQASPLLQMANDLHDHQVEVAVTELRS